MERTALALVITLAASAACGASRDASSEEPGPAPGPTGTAELLAIDGPIAGITGEERARFDRGDFLFDVVLREGDGLGPLFTRANCSGCHADAARGPGLVQKMALVTEDGSPATDQSAFPFGHTVHPLTAGGGKTAIAVPSLPRVKVTSRVGPPVLGRGYMEAVLDEEIARVAREQAARTDGIRGRLNHVVYASEKNSEGTVHRHARGDVVVGRFGLKARIGYLDDFTADALQGDMGITSPLRPDEIRNPDGLTDDAKAGVDVTLESVNLRSDYVRLIAIPTRLPGTDAAGAELFRRARCDVCHVPSLRTRPDYPIAALAGIDAPVFTDMLLHDMGPELADGLPPGQDGEATAREWRTAPLIGLRFLQTYLHDSRAHSIDEAVRLHGKEGSQAAVSVRAYEALSAAEQKALLDYVGSL